MFIQCTPFCVCCFCIFSLFILFAFLYKKDLHCTVSTGRSGLLQSVVFSELRVPPFMCICVYVYLCICVFLYLYNVHREEWSVAECSLIWVERSSFYPSPPTLQRTLRILFFLLPWSSYFHSSTEVFILLQPDTAPNPENSLFPRWLFNDEI